MMSVSTIGRFLSVFAIILLAVVPIVRPTMALPNGNMAIIDDAAMSMPEGMACCPKQTPIPDCGKDCPLMAICATHPCLGGLRQMQRSVSLTYLQAITL